LPVSCSQFPVASCLFPVASGQWPVASWQARALSSFIPFDDALRLKLRAVSDVEPLRALSLSKGFRLHPSRLVHLRDAAGGANSVRLVHCAGAPAAPAHGGPSAWVRSKAACAWPRHAPKMRPSWPPACYPATGPLTACPPGV